VEQANGAVLAPPGVIGYIAGTNTLTLKGSTEYKNATAVDSNGDGVGDIEQYAIDNFGGLSDQTVIMAYFKYHSLIAISSDPTDNVAPTIEAEDIIAAPSIADGYIGLEALQAKAQTSGYGVIPYGGSGMDPANGQGDPCAYYTDFFGTGWKTPQAQPYTGTPNYTATNLVYYDWGALGTRVPAGRLSTRDGETGMYYIFGGMRDYQSGAVSVQHTQGYYMAYTNIYTLHVNSGSADPTTGADPKWGLNVRCVRAE
jgi:hypothetical protein